MRYPVSQSQPLLWLGLALLLALTAGLRPVPAQSPSAGQKQRPRRVGDSAATTAVGSANKTQTSSSEEVDDGDVVRVDTQLVSVPAVVTNSLGRPLAGLQAVNFVYSRMDSRSNWPTLPPRKRRLKLRCCWIL